MEKKRNSWIEVIPFGGADTVTGSRFLVRLFGGKKHYLVDAGLFMGKCSKKLNENIGGLAKKIDAIFVTHAHVDHVGALPFLQRLGYRGPIYATAPVKRLCDIVLPDAARIQETENLHIVKKSGLTNKELISAAGLAPLYTVANATEVMKQFVIVERGDTIRIDDYLEVTFYNAGHHLGSCSIMLDLDNGEEHFRLYFSGDIGQSNSILKQRRDSFKEDVDFVVMETTYADREHSDKSICWSELREVVANSIKDGGNVIFPSLTVGRTQEMLYHYYKDMTENDDWVAQVFRKTPVVVDSCMAVQATGIFKEFPDEFKSSVAKMLENERNNPFSFPQLTMVLDADDSKQVTQEWNNYIVFSGAGMCNAGRVLYHLEKDIKNPKSAIVFTCFQAEGTLGRRIVEGASEVKIHGVVYPVRAKIACANAFSAHVDKHGLVKWLSRIDSGYKLFLAHGEPSAQESFKQGLVERGLFAEDDVELMQYGTVYHLYKGGFETSQLSIPGNRQLQNKNESDGVKKILMLVEKMRDQVEDAFDDSPDLEIWRVLNELEQEISKLKADKKAKFRGKFNQYRSGRRR